MNAKTEILKLTKDEKILAISIGKDPRRRYEEDEGAAEFFEGADVEKALRKLNFEFDSSWGGEEGYSVYVWTDTKVIVKGTYDGSEWYTFVPRNPSKTPIPESIGGG
mgnify:FL=1